MTFKRCEARTCTVCDIGEILDGLKDAGMGVEMSISTVLFCVGQVYGLEVEAGRIADAPDCNEVVH